MVYVVLDVEDNGYLIATLELDYSVRAGDQITLEGDVDRQTGHRSREIYEVVGVRIQLGPDPRHEGQWREEAIWLDSRRAPDPSTR